MKTFRAFFIGVAVAAAAAMPACGFQAFDLAAAEDGSSGGNTTTSGTTGGDEDASIDIGSDGEAPNPSAYAELCGEGCRPGDEAEECAGVDGGGGGGSGGGGAGGGSEGVVVACQLVPGQDGHAAPQCGQVGSFGATGPCDSVASCAAGFGCAATPEGTGACRQYCCGNVEDCAVDTYCAPQPMQEEAAVQIPVCIPADKCTLLTDACGEGRTCTIVRADGTTSCVEPGAGRAGDACPCAAGFVCSLLTNQCKKLCHLEQDATDCGPDAKCQGGSMGYPPGFGICVGPGF